MSTFIEILTKPCPYEFEIVFCDIDPCVFVSMYERVVGQPQEIMNSRFVAIEDDWLVGCSICHAPTSCVIG